VGRISIEDTMNPATTGRRWRVGAWALAFAPFLVLGACAPSVEMGPVGDSLAARKALEQALAEGPARAQIFGDPYGLDPARQDQLVTSAMGDGVAGAKARFSADPGVYGQDQPRLVVILNPMIETPSAEACRAPERIRTGAATDVLTLIAAFCDGENLINGARAEGEVHGPTDQRLKRMLWQTSGVLFPDNYQNEYGINLFPGFNLGFGGSFGF